MTPAAIRQGAAGALLVCISAWLTARAYPDTSHCELAWLSLVPFLLAVRRATAVQAMSFGALWMLVFAWGLNDWFPHAAARYLAQPLPVGFAFFLGVTFGTAAPATIAFALYYRRRGPQPSVAAPLAAAAAWVACELMRADLLGDPWGLLGYSQAQRPVWIQIADIGGVYAVSFVVLLVNAVVAELILAAARAGRTDGAGAGMHATLRLAGALTALAIVVTAPVAGYGLIRLAAGARPQPGGLDVAVVQGNLDLERQWAEPMHAANLETYLDLTDRALAAGRIRLVVWPENAITFFLDGEHQRRAEIASRLSAHGATLLAGAPHRTPDREPSFFNSAFLVAPDGSIAGRYDKQRLLPFGEYQPVAGLAVVAGRFDRVREFAAGGAGNAPLEIGGATIGVVICNEAMFPGPSRERVQAGAGVLVALTNDSWVGVRKFAAQAMDKAVFRAVEQRRWLVRASTSGPSAIVDAEGRIVSRTRFAEEATLSGRVQVLAGTSPYSTMGDAFAWACVIGALLMRPGRPGEVAA